MLGAMGVAVIGGALVLNYAINREETLEPQPAPVAVPSAALAPAGQDSATPTAQPPADGKANTGAAATPPATGPAPSSASGTARVPASPASPTATTGPAPAATAVASATAENPPAASYRGTPIPLRQPNMPNARHARPRPAINEPSIAVDLTVIRVPPGPR